MVPSLLVPRRMISVLAWLSVTAGPRASTAVKASRCRSPGPSAQRAKFFHYPSLLKTGFFKLQSDRNVAGLPAGLGKNSGTRAPRETISILWVISGNYAKLCICSPGAREGGQVAGSHCWSEAGGGS